MSALFRKEPLSVKFEWPADESDYAESVYVEGQNRDKLLVRERKGLLGLRPQVRVLNVMDPVKFGRARNPITEFGLARLVERTLIPFDDPEIRDKSSISYQGVSTPELTDRLVHVVRIERPPTPGLRYTRQDFYIDAETLLPAGTDLLLPGGDIEARYRYYDIDLTASLTDGDFRLTQGHPSSMPAAAGAALDP
jgi:hypothetical protein